MVSRGSSKRNNPIAEAEHIASLIAQEAKKSLSHVTRVLGKVVAVSFLGFLLASNCCLSQYLVPMGVFILAIAAGWLDVIREECSLDRFFPSKSLNAMGAYLFLWQWLALAASVIFMVSSTGAVRSLQLDFHDRVWNFMKYAAVPLFLMLIGRHFEPYKFRRARTEVQTAESLLRQLVSVPKKSESSSLTPLVEAEQIPLYKLGSVASLLRGLCQSYDATDKLSVDLVQPADTTSKPLVSMIYSPFRKLAGEILLWESRDIVLYIVVAMYAALVYLGSKYFPLAPLCIICPFLGPKSKCARFVNALQEDIRLAQGASVAKKGGCAATQTALEGGWLAIKWPMLIYLTLSHMGAFWALMVWTLFGGVCPVFGQEEKPMKWETVYWGFFLYLIGGLGITAGVHRLWAHRTYKAALPLRIVLMIFNSVANQGTIYHWARDHRVHHLYSDTDADPHDANRGFWYSHCGWLVLKKRPEVAEAGRKVNVEDLRLDPVVMFQKRVDPFWNLIWCFAMPAFVALQWDDTLWNGFLVAGAFKYIWTLNITWCVNSVVHAWGTKPYNPVHLTTENGWVSLFALGEGWHNWHHAFDWDYAAAELEPWYQFNPTKVFIDTMALLGLVWGRKRASKVWDLRKAKWEEETGRKVIESMEGPPLFKRRVVTLGPQPYDDHDEVADKVGGS